MNAVTTPILAVGLAVAIAGLGAVRAQTLLKSQTPVTFPLDAKYAVVDVNAVASSSVIGKAASKRLNDLQSTMAGEIEAKNKQLKALQARRHAGGSQLSETARAQLDTDINRLQRDLQYAPSVPIRLRDLKDEVMADFTTQVRAAAQEIAKEKGLYIVFTTDLGVAYAAPEINISDEVIKRLDAKKH